MLSGWRPEGICNYVAVCMGGETGMQTGYRGWHAIVSKSVMRAGMHTTAVEQSKKC